jgi:hypothetical protein
MIIVRIGLGLNSSRVESSEAISTLFIAPARSTRPIPSEGNHSTHVDSHPMGPLAVKVTQDTFQFQSTAGESSDGKVFGLGFEHDLASGIAS